MVRKDEDPASQRYFSAFGRDVDVQECELSYDATTRSLTITGGCRKQSVTEHAWYVIGKYIKEHPGCHRPQSSKRSARTKTSTK
jgi:hypothetical protein